MLFIINEKDVLLHPEAVKLEPTLGSLPMSDLLFIILAYDYNSPYKQLPEGQRLLTSCRRAFDNDEVEKAERRLMKATALYQGLQYDIRRETIKNYQAKAAQLNLQLMGTESPGEIKKLHDAIEFLTKTSFRLQKELISEDLSEVGGLDDSASLLEKWMDNRRKYKNDKKVIDLARKQDLK